MTACGSDYSWILRLWTDKVRLVQKVRRDGLRTAPTDEARLTDTR